MLVDPATDVRDDFNAWTGSAANHDTVYIPDLSGTGYKVSFVERINRGLAADALCVYLDRLAVPWPFPGPGVVGMNPHFGPAAGGTTVTITGRDYTGATQVSFGTSAAASFVVNSDTQITAVSPAHATATVDVTVTTPLGTSGTLQNDWFTFGPLTNPCSTYNGSGGPVMSADTYWTDINNNFQSTTTGSTLYVTVAFDVDPGTVTGPSGYTLLVSDATSGSPWHYAFTYENAPSETDFTISWTNSANYAIVGAEIFGAAASSADGLNHAAGSASPASGGSANVTVSADMGIADVAWYGPLPSSPPYSPPWTDGYTALRSITSAGTNAVSIAIAVLSGIQVGSTSTLAPITTTGWSAIISTWKPA